MFLLKKLRMLANIDQYKFVIGEDISDCCGKDEKHHNAVLELDQLIVQLEFNVNEQVKSLIEGVFSRYDENQKLALKAESHHLKAMKKQNDKFDTNLLTEKDKFETLEYKLLEQK